jgi:rRNA maturation endonuclease Nob1
MIGKMSKYSVGEAFSAGLGLAMGLTMVNYLSQAMKPSGKMMEQVIICVKCGSKNPSENRFCGRCGQPLYPPPPIQCPVCMAIMPAKNSFCGRCGSPLRKTKKTRKRRS